MKHWRLISWASLSLVFVVGCSSGSSGSKPVTTSDTIIDPWFLVLTDPEIKTPAYLSNGRSGARYARDGMSSIGEDGEFISESAWLIDGNKLDPSTGWNYRQSLSLRNGVLKTKWQQYAGSKRIKTTCLTWFRGESTSLWYFLSDTDAILSSDEPRGTGVSIELEAGVGKLVGDPDLVSSIQGEEGEIFEWGFLSPLGIYPLEDSADIEIEGSVEDERAIRSMLFYLRSSFGTEIPPGPMGLSNDTYNGHIFWDSDVWMFPALAFVEPNSASKISRFRIDHLHEASMLADSTLFPPMDIQWGDNFPARYPWESDVSGRDVTEGPTKKGDHQSGGVAWSLDMASALGLVDIEDSERVGSAVANYYKLRLAKETNQAEIHDIKGVDEWFEGDNGLYTNVIADWTIKKFLGEDVNMYYPRDEKGLLAYDGDNRTAYKQAAAPLILWPLEREDLVDDPIAFLDMFEGKEAPNGPAMSLSIYALIRARYGNADTAYETWQESWKRYTDGNPLLLFSEIEGRSDRTYFLTGAAGCLNAVIYGFIGVRILDDEPTDDAKLPLENGKWLVIRPNLPKAWKSITFHGMQLLGEQYTVVCKGRTATITKL